LLGACLFEVAYVELLVVARSLLAGSLELLAHGADLLVNVGELGGRHFGISAAANQQVVA
jgi:hypothetical protein